MSPMFCCFKKEKEVAASPVEDVPKGVVEESEEKKKEREDAFDAPRASTVSGRKPKGKKKSEESKLLNVVLDKVANQFPGVGTCVIISLEGDSPEIIHPRKLKDARFDEPALNVIVRFKKSALSLAEALGESTCDCLHVQGEKHLFSCYDIPGGSSVLVFYSEYGNDQHTMIGKGNTNIQELCGEISQVLASGED